MKKSIRLSSGEFNATRPEQKLKEKLENKPTPIALPIVCLLDIELLLIAEEDHAMGTGSETSEQFLVLSDSLGLHFVD